MRWFEDLEKNESLAILTMITGVIVYVCNHLFQTVFIYQVFVSDKIGSHGHVELTLLYNSIDLLAIFILGIGFFLSLRILNKKFDIYKYFTHLNITYLVLLFTNLIFAFFQVKRYLSAISGDSYPTSELPAVLESVFTITFTMIPGIRRAVLLIMLLLTIKMLFECYDKFGQKSI